MGFKIINLVKQVPDTTNVPDNAMKPDGTVNRSALPAITNPEDLHALEEALKIKDTRKTHITALTLGPPTAIKVLKDSLYRGADDAILITDMKFAASDTLATSYALTRAIEKIGEYDLILCGRQAIDGDTAQVGPQIAENLNINQLTGVIEIIAITDNTITVRRALDDGYEIVKSNLPVLVTVIAEANEPRYPSVKRMLRYKNITCEDSSYINPEPHCSSTHIAKWNAEDIAADPIRIGMAGSPTKVKNIENVVLTARNTRMLNNTDNDISALINELISEHIIA